MIMYWSYKYISQTKSHLFVYESVRLFVYYNCFVLEILNSTKVSLIVRVLVPRARRTLDDDAPPQWNHKEPKKNGAPHHDD